MPPEDAARAARKAFGNVTSTRERYYEAGRRLWLDHLTQDLRAAARSLVRYPVVTVVAVLSLAAGIAATAASLTLRESIFQNPPPLYRDPQQLSKVQVNRRDRPIRPAGSFVPGDVYANAIAAFHVPWVVAFYLLAMVALGLHLYHGVWSSARTLGLAGAKPHPLHRPVALVLAVALWLGFSLVPFAIALGWVR
jgi:hypothetical protein